MTVISPDLIFAFRAIEKESTKQHLQIWASAEGNPMGAEVEERVWGTLFFFAGRPRDNIYNRAVALRPGLLDHLTEISDAFSERNLTASVEVTFADLAEDGTERGTARLLEAGFRPRSTEGIYYGETDKDYAPPPEGVDVRPVECLEERFALIDVHHRGWQSSPEIVAAWRPVGTKLFDDPAVTGYIAYVEGQPAGSGILQVQDGIGYFADASVDPAYRRRGCQRALFHARLEAARERGCELVFSMAEFADQSARNMESFGLRLASEVWHWGKV